MNPSSAPGGGTVETWDAVVLGGGDPNDPFAAAHGVPVKALIDLAGVPMGERVLRALKGSGRVARVAYVGPLTPAMRDLVDVEVPQAGALLTNLEAGLRALNPDGTAPGARVLVVTADVPLMTAGVLRDVLDAAHAQSPDAALVYPVVPREACDAAYPGMKRTYARLRDGTFTGGNVFLLDPALIGAFMPRLRGLLAMRKRPLALARLIGLDVLLGLLTGRLTIHALERRVSRILGVQARALITTHATIGTDVDKDADLRLVRERLGEGGEAHHGRAAGDAG